MTLARNNILIAAIQLSIGLLEQHHPNLILMILGEEHLIIMRRKVIINNDAFPKPINKQPHPIKPIGTYLCCLEEPLHYERILANATDS